MIYIVVAIIVAVVVSEFTIFTIYYSITKIIRMFIVIQNYNWQYKIYKI